MGNYTDTSSRVSLSETNKVTQTSIAKCNITCNQDQSDNTVIISSGATTGNITFSQVCVIEDAKCTINTNIETTIKNEINSLIDQKAMATQPIFAGTFSYTRCASSLDEAVTNQITQLLSSNCTIETNQTMNNNYVYVGTGATTGNISFAQHSVLSNVECVMDIVSKANAYNSETGNVTQKATTIDSLSILFIVIGIVVVMIVVMLIVFLIGGGTKIIGKVVEGATGGGGGGEALPEGALPGGEGAAAAEGGALEAGGSAEILSLVEANPELLLL
jgi:hypothetical protein